MVLVSALIQQSDRRMSHDISTYFDSFGKIAALGLPTVLFCNETLRQGGGLIINYYDNVIKRAVTIYDLPLRKRLPSVVQLPAGRNPAKDTLDYLVMMNSKTQMMRWAMDLFPNEDRFAWVDAGICHFMKRPDLTLEKLKQIEFAPKGVVTIPGMRTDPQPVLDYPFWRFAGSFFTGDRAALTTFWDKADDLFNELLPSLTWEINLWTMLEVNGDVPFLWYDADHNDTILDFPIGSYHDHRPGSLTKS